jgi:hypothetical protein
VRVLDEHGHVVAGVELADSIGLLLREQAGRRRMPTMPSALSVPCQADIQWLSAVTTPAIAEMRTSRAP